MMTATDQDFRDEFKPIHIPTSYHPSDTQENKIIYALAQLGDATADDVVSKLEEIEPGVKDEQLKAITCKVLDTLYEKGLLKGTDQGGIMHYNLSKITHANDGAVDPDLLAPGLD